MRVAIALGSNLGDREQTLRKGAALVGAVVSHLQLSPLIETAPVGVGDQPPFLNAAAVGMTTVTPRALLEVLLATERACGRERPYGGAPRTLDLDLILFGETIITEADLIVPHPRFRDRTFVLEPLAAVAPDWMDPVTGQTIRELLARLTTSA